MEEWRFKEGIFMTYKNLIYEIVEKVGIIKVNRPEVRSFFNWETWMGFEDTLRQLHSDPNLRVGIGRGPGHRRHLRKNIICKSNEWQRVK